MAFLHWDHAIYEDAYRDAVVMGHEIAHAVAAMPERMSNGLVSNFGVSLLSSAFGQES